MRMIPSGREYQTLDEVKKDLNCVQTNEQLIAFLQNNDFVEPYRLYYFPAWWVGLLERKHVSGLTLPTKEDVIERLEEKLGGKKLQSTIITPNNRRTSDPLPGWLWHAMGFDPAEVQIPPADEQKTTTFNVKGEDMVNKTVDAEYVEVSEEKPTFNPWYAILLGIVGLGLLILFAWAPFGLVLSKPFWFWYATILTVAFGILLGLALGLVGYIRKINSGRFPRMAFHTPRRTVRRVRNY